MALAADIGTEAHRIAERELRLSQAAEAYDLGYKHVAVCINEFGEGDARLLEKVFSRAAQFDNPFKMVAMGDEGHQRPEWSRGFNRALAEHYGIKIIDRSDMGEDNEGALNGYVPTTAHCSTRMKNVIDAENVARELTRLLGAPFWPEDRGEWVSPRHAVIRGFQMGEPVSYGFNGDSYQAGRIIAMSGGHPDIGPRIITTRDHNGVVRKFWRCKLSGSWKHEQTWSLMHGWHNDRNPEF